jgi:hypothetical protein
VISDVMAAKRGNDVGAPSPFEHSCLLPDDLEGGADPAGRENVGDPFRRIIARGQQVILRIEPEDDQHVAGSRGRKERRARGKGHAERQRRRDRQMPRPNHRGIISRSLRAARSSSSEMTP